MVNPLVIGACVAAGVGSLAFLALGGDSRAKKRRAALGGAGAKDAGKSGQSDRAQRKKQIAEGLRELEKNSRKRISLQTRIDQTGLPVSSRQFVIGSVAFGVLVAAAILVRFGSPLIAALVGVIAGAGAPPFLLKFLRRRRINKFVANFPNAIDLIVRGVKSGLPLGDTMRIAATETVEPVKTEFRKIVEALSLGLTLPEAVERMAQRVPITETNFFSIVIAIQGKAGGNLSEAIGNLSRVLRERKKMKGKISAMSMEAKASAVIIGAVPFVVVAALYASAPKYVSLLWTTTHGRLIAGIALAWMGVGLAMMKKMITFDF
jgi:tight adherence protein B